MLKPALRRGVRTKSLRRVVVAVAAVARENVQRTALRMAAAKNRPVKARRKAASMIRTTTRSYLKTLKLGRPKLPSRTRHPTKLHRRRASRDVQAPAAGVVRPVGANISNQ